MMSDGTVRVVIETTVMLGFKSAQCVLPSYQWEKVNGFSQEEIGYYDSYLRSLSHVILELAQTGVLTMPQIFRIAGHLIFLWSYNILKIASARHADIEAVWKERFGEIRYDC